MTIKLLLLKSGEYLISNVKEGYLENTLVCYMLENPCLISSDGSYKKEDKLSKDSQTKLNIILQSWPVLSKDTTIEIIPDWIITIVNPNDELKKIYETQVLEIKENEINQTIILNEQSNTNQSD
jgi:hypothetical protein